MRFQWFFVLATTLSPYFGTSQSQGQVCFQVGCRCSPAIGIHEERRLENWENSPAPGPGFEVQPFLSGPQLFTVRTFWIGSTPEFPQGRIHRILVPMASPSAATIPRPVAPVPRPRYSPWISQMSAGVPVSQALR